MKASNSALIASVIALVSFLTIGITFLINRIINNSQVVPLLAYIWIALLVIVILCGILVIIQTVREKRVNKPDNSNVTSATKDISTRFILREGPVTIEASDAESVIKALQVLFKGESSLKAELQLTVEIKEPEASDVPETKENEE